MPSDNLQTFGMSLFGALLVILVFILILMIGASIGIKQDCYQNIAYSYCIDQGYNDSYITSQKNGDYAFECENLSTRIIAQQWSEQFLFTKREINFCEAQK